MRKLTFAAGVFFVGLGALGAALPLLPTVPFLLLAVFCFARSNPEWERRILEHPTYGPQIVEWQTRGAITRKTKVVSIATIAAGVGFTWVTIGFPWVWISLGALVVVGGWIATRPE